VKILNYYLSIVCLSTFALSAQQAHIRGLPILFNSTSYSQLGFNDCNMRSNGEMLVIEKLVHQGDIVFDVGANVGDWSIATLQAHSPLTIYAFEPAPTPYALLQKHLNEYNNISINNLALSDTTGKANFNYYQKDSTMGGLFKRPIVEKIFHQQPSCFEVNTQTLDSFCQERSINNIDFLKIDTEGAELAVLLGAHDMLIHNNIKTIQFEYGGTYPDAKITLKEVYDLLSSCGYKIYRISSKGLIWINTWTNDLENSLYSNYIATVLDQQ